MLKNVWARIKSQKGMSGVLVAVLLVVVGVGLVAGLNTYVTKAKDNSITAADAKLVEAGVLSAK